jgi:hypothetical protein
VASARDGSEGRAFAVRSRQLHAGGVKSPNRDQQASITKGPTMSDKSPRQAMSKKSGKSLKEKRADKRVNAALRAKSTETLLHDKKR